MELIKFLYQYICFKNDPISFCLNNNKVNTNFELKKLNHKASLFQNFYGDIKTFMYLVILKWLTNKKRVLITDTVKNNVTSPNFLVWKFCGKAHFSHSFGRFTRNYAETVPFLQNFHTMKLGEVTVFYAVLVVIDAIIIKEITNKVHIKSLASTSLRKMKNVNLFT